jgi:hypothetical protein
MAIEYAFVVSIIASFSVVGVAGFMFGLRLGQWVEWQGVLVGVIATIAGVVGAVFGLHMSWKQDGLELRHHATRNIGASKHTRTRRDKSLIRH